MSQTTDEWLNLYDAQTEATGTAITATVGAVTDKAIVSQIGTDQIFVPGGTGQAGGFNIQMLASAFTELPAKFSAISTHGNSLKVDSVNTNNGILYIAATDPTANE